MADQTTTSYDSRPATYEHIGQVRGLLIDVATELLRRAHMHDASKLVEPELSVFNEVSPLLHGLTYGSPEYEHARAQMGDALQHHYDHNDHHPEFHERGVAGMDLVELTEMLCDWVAAASRHADGDVRESLEINQRRFGYGDELKGILANTLNRIDPWHHGVA